MLIKKRYLKGKIFFPINNDFNKKTILGICFRG